MPGTGTTYTLNTLLCNAELQQMIVQTGLTFLDGEMQYLRFDHGTIRMMGWLKYYNSANGVLRAQIEEYNGGGGDSYKNWWVTTIDHPVRDVNINFATLRSLIRLSGDTAATYDQISDLAIIVGKMYLGFHSLEDNQI